MSPIACPRSWRSVTGFTAICLGCRDRSGPKRLRLALAEAEGCLAALDAADSAAWQQWALAPAGEAPTPSHKERTQLEQKRALAAADVRAADSAVAGVQGRVAQLHSELRALGPKIFEVKLEGVLGELPELEKALVDALRVQADSRLKIRGLMAALDGNNRMPWRAAMRSARRG